MKHKRTVLFVCTSGLPAPGGGGRTRIISAAKQARKHGYDVKLLCFFSFRQGRSLLADKKKLQEESGCKVYYFPKLPLRRFSLILRVNYIYSSLVVFLIALINAAGLVHGHGFTAAFFAIRAKRWGSNHAVIADVHGVSLEEAVYAGNITKDDPVAKLYRRRENHVIINADHILFVSNAMRHYYQRHRSTLNEVSTIIPCAVEADFVIDTLNRKKLRDKFGLQDDVVFSYLGSAASYQLIDEMCQLFSKILALVPNSFFLIISHHQDAFRKALRTHSINSKYYSIITVDHKEVFDLLQVGDIGFLLRDDSIVNRVSSPTKFAEYCLAGLPVITTKFVGDYSTVVENSNLGYVLDLKTLNITPEFILFIEDVQSKRQEYADRCKSYAKTNLSWERYGKILADLYSVVGKFE